jgi:hypothetical protein
VLGTVAADWTFVYETLNYLYKTNRTSKTIFYPKPTPMLLYPPPALHKYLKVGVSSWIAVDELIEIDGNARLVDRTILIINLSCRPIPIGGERNGTCNPFISRPINPPKIPREIESDLRRPVRDNRTVWNGILDRRGFSRVHICELESRWCSMLRQKPGLGVNDEGFRPEFVTRLSEIDGIVAVEELVVLDVDVGGREDVDVSGEIGGQLGGCDVAGFGCGGSLTTDEGECGDGGGGEGEESCCCVDDGLHCGLSVLGVLKG